MPSRDQGYWPKSAQGEDYSYIFTIYNRLQQSDMTEHVTI